MSVIGVGRGFVSRLGQLGKRCLRVVLGNGRIANLHRKRVISRRFSSYAHKPDPFEVLWVSPRDVVYVSGRPEAHQRRKAELGSIIAGDWDLRRDRFEETYFHRWITQRYGLGYAWEETEYYQRKMAQRAAGGEKGRSNEEMRARMTYRDKLFESLKRSGYRLQREIEPGVDLMTCLVNEICVDIGRDGALMVVDSKHRLAMALVLGIERVPVTVIARHPEWMALRDRVLSGSAEEMIANRYRHHPDIETPRESQSSAASRSPFVSAIRAEKRLVIEQVRRASRWLRPGFWVVSRGGVGHEWREDRFPQFLLETKLRGTRRGGYRGRLGRILYRLVPPLGIHVPPGEGVYSILLSTKGGTLLMDPTAGFVLRMVADSQELREVAGIREQMLPYIKSPAFEILEGGTAVREELVVGRTFRELPAMARAAAWRQLTCGYAGLAKARAGGNAGELVAAALAATEQCELPKDLGSVIGRDRMELLRWAGQQPLVPAHGDVSDENLVITPEGVPMLIDFEGRCAGMLPCYHDSFLLVIREAKRGRLDLLERIMGGEEEEALACLWPSGGTIGGGDVKFAILSALLVHVYRRNPHPGPANVERMGGHLQGMWRPLAVYFRGD